MNRSSLLLALCLAFGSLLSTVRANDASTNHCTYVLVHGAWGGGWDWRHVDDLLTADGNKVFRATLTGQGERSHLASTNIDLDMHIQDVVNLIVWEDLHDVVLVGHSYGGMVITGVADRIPDRIKHIVYLDAILPENGESAFAAIRGRTGLITNNYILPTWVQGNPPPPHDVPMPVKTFSQPISLTNQAVVQKLPATYILTVDPGQPAEKDTFYPFYVRAQGRHWPAWIMTGDHNVSVPIVSNSFPCWKKPRSKSRPISLAGKILRRPKSRC